MSAASIIRRTDRLADLGLREEFFLQASDDAMSAYNRPTDLHPRTAAGFYFWAEFLASLRLSLLPLGWSAGYIRGHDVTMNPERTRAIIVTRGDESTGDLESTPKTNSRKGRVTEAVVNQNAHQLLLIPPSQLPPRQLHVPDISLPEELQNIEVWMALYHRDFEEGKLWLELSLPTGLDRSKKAGDWDHRIPIGPVDMHPDIVDLGELSYEDGPEIDIEVLRREG